MEPFGRRFGRWWVQAESHRLPVVRHVASSILRPCCRMCGRLDKVSFEISITQERTMSYYCKVNVVLCFEQFERDTLEDPRFHSNDASVPWMFVAADHRFPCMCILSHRNAQLDLLS